mgnify:CR=1 FL=1
MCDAQEAKPFVEAKRTLILSVDAGDHYVLTQCGRTDQQRLHQGAADALSAAVGTDVDQPPAAYAWSKELKGGPLPLPRGWDGLHLAFVRGDFLYGLRAQPPTAPSSPTDDERVQWRRPTQLVRWNVRANVVESFASPVLAIHAASTTGWVVVQTQERSDPRALIMAPDGSVRGWSGGQVQWIAPDGRTLIGIDTHLRPMKWTCP